MFIWHFESEKSYFMHLIWEMKACPSKILASNFFKNLAKNISLFSNSNQLSVREDLFINPIQNPVASPVQNPVPNPAPSPVLSPVPSPKVAPIQCKLCGWNFDDESFLNIHTVLMHSQKSR